MMTSRNKSFTTKIKIDKAETENCIVKGKVGVQVVVDACPSGLRLVISTRTW
jgi:hypothetical protein